MTDDASPAGGQELIAEKTEAAESTAAVRFGKMGYIGEFRYTPGQAHTRGAKVVISTSRGIEIGEQVALGCSGCPGSLSPEQTRAYAKASGPDSYRFREGRILRGATESDLAELRHIVKNESDKLETGRRFAEELDLKMKIIDCEHVFGGERIIFYFIAEERVDFRELVRGLASEFQTRIEMRQVGARDEARLLADYETCGRECCCKNFLKTLKPITMSMAKLQKTTLDLAKVSGRCGRLKCCLRYEHESYQGLDKSLPRVGKRVATTDGTGRIIDRQILTQLLKVATDDGRTISVTAEQILEVDPPEKGPEAVPSKPAGKPNVNGRDSEPKQSAVSADEATPEFEPDSTPEDPSLVVADVAEDSDTAQDSSSSAVEGSTESMPSDESKSDSRTGRKGRGNRRRRSRRRSRNNSNSPPNGSSSK